MSSTAIEAYDTMKAGEDNPQAREEGELPFIKKGEHFGTSWNSQNVGSCSTLSPSKPTRGSEF